MNATENQSQSGIPSRSEWDGFNPAPHVVPASAGSPGAPQFEVQTPAQIQSAADLQWPDHLRPTHPADAYDYQLHQALALQQQKTKNKPEQQPEQDPEQQPEQPATSLAPQQDTSSAPAPKPTRTEAQIQLEIQTLHQELHALRKQTCPSDPPHWTHSSHPSHPSHNSHSPDPAIHNPQSKQTTSPPWNASKPNSTPANNPAARWTA